MATPWENKQNGGLLHKVLKVGEDNKQHNSTLTLKTCYCAECGTIYLWNVIICTTTCSDPSEKQSHPKKNYPKNMLGIPNQIVKSIPCSVRRYICSFPNICSRTVFVFAILPWVARSQVVLYTDGDLLRDRLPRAIMICPLWGIDSGKIVNGFQILNFINLLHWLPNRKKATKWINLNNPRCCLRNRSFGFAQGPDTERSRSGSPEVGWTFTNMARSQKQVPNRASNMGLLHQTYWTC